MKILLQCTLNLYSCFAPNKAFPGLTSRKGVELPRAVLQKFPLDPLLIKIHFNWLSFLLKIHYDLLVFGLINNHYCTYVLKNMIQKFTFLLADIFPKVFLQAFFTVPHQYNSTPIQQNCACIGYKHLNDCLHTPTHWADLFKLQDLRLSCILSQQRTAHIFFWYNIPFHQVLSVWPISSHIAFAKFWVLFFFTLCLIS